MQNELDRNLQLLFREKNLELPAEPFCIELIARIEKARLRRIRVRKLMLILALAGCAAMSPYLIALTTLLCSGLNEILEAIEVFLATTKGIIAVASIALLLAIWKRRWISTYV